MSTLTESASTYDPGPLLWVRGEIEHSLTETRTNLDTVNSNPDDAAAAQAVAADLHQVTGALRMVGLGAAARLTEEIEKLTATFKAPVPADLAQRIVIAKHAITKLSHYLDSLVAGRPDRPMALAEPYAMVNKARGADDASPSDLFSPDLTIEVPVLSGAGTGPGADGMAEAIGQQRGMFQAGLLKLLRDKDLVGGAREMGDAVLGIEALLAASPSRAFWFTAGGFFDAVANDPAGTGAYAVRLFGKIDQQIKMLIGGTDETPEKLFRELLLVIGRSAARTERIDQIREMYRLDELLSAPEQQPAGKKPDKELAAAVRAAKDQVQSLKDYLLLFISGDSSALEPLAKQSESLAMLGQRLPNQEMSRLLQLLGSVGRHLRQTGRPPNEAQALEIATTMLFIEEALDEYFELGAEFDKQAALIFSRVRGIMSGEALPAFDRSVNNLADTMTLRAQTHLLVFQVGREVQANLAAIERTLDDYFRDAEKAPALATLDPLFKQVRGAFAMLEEDEAAALTKTLGERAAKYASGEIKGEGEEAGSMAEGISALGLYVDALQRHSPDSRAVLLPTLLRFGLAKKPEKKSAAKAGTGKAETARKEPEKPRVDEKPAPPPTATHTRRPAEAKPAPSPTATHTRRPVEAKQEKPATATHTRRPGTARQAEPEASAAPEKAQTVVEAAVAPRATTADQGEVELLRKSEAKLKIEVHERDQRIRALQAQMVALHGEAKKVTKLEAELKAARAALTKALRKG